MGLLAPFFASTSTVHDMLVSWLQAWRRLPVPAHNNVKCFITTRANAQRHRARRARALSLSLPPSLSLSHSPSLSPSISLSPLAPPLLSVTGTTVWLRTQASCCGTQG